MVLDYLKEVMQQFRDIEKETKDQIISPMTSGPDRDKLVQRAQEALYKADLLEDVIELEFSAFFPEEAEKYEER